MRHVRLNLLAAAALVACAGSKPPAINAYRSTDSAFALANRVVSASQAGSATSPCGSSPPTAQFSELILVTGRACLSCRGIGNLIRRSSLGRGPQTPLVAIPEADSGEVCPFLREERITNSVIALPESIFPGDVVGSTVVVATVDSNGRVRSAIYGRDVVDLLPKMDSLRAGR